MIIRPVNKTSNGITESSAPMTLNFSGELLYTLKRPSSGFPSPILISAKNGIANPPINRPYPLRVSDTATALSPPKIAYKEPISPIAQMV